MYACVFEHRTLSCTLYINTTQTQIRKRSYKYKYKDLHNIKHSIKSSIFMMLLMFNDDTE